jgi:hypothetical protein
MNYTEIFNEANKIARSFTIEGLGDNVMVYPCGFAHIYLNNGIRGKNNPLGKELQQLGLLQYDAYFKHYYVYINDYNQSLIHKYTHARYLAITLSEKLGVLFSYDSKID